MQATRIGVLERLYARKKDGIPIVGAGVGTLEAAWEAERNGVDFVVFCSYGQFTGSAKNPLVSYMPFGDPNGIVTHMAPAVSRHLHIPLLAGVCGTSPFCDIGQLFQTLKVSGTCGIMNFPTFGICDGMFRQNLEEADMGFGAEITLVERAAGADFLTVANCFSVKDAKGMAQAGVDIIVACLPLASDGNRYNVVQNTYFVQELYDNVVKIRPGILVLYGGAFDLATEEAYEMFRCAQGMAGYFSFR